MTRSYTSDAYQPIYGGDTTAVPRAPAAKPRCEDIGFEHAWELMAETAMDIDRHRRRCKNCGRIEENVNAWRVVQDAEPSATKPRCEDIGYEHLWVYTPPVEVTEMQMPEKAFLPASRRCKNCGRVERQVTEWRVVRDAEPTR